MANRGIYNSGGGLRQCEQPNSFLLMNPHSRYHHISTPTKTKDSISQFESKTLLLEKNAQAQLHKLLPNEKLVVVARAGKLLFYAVALPPYVLLYGIPKWISGDLFALLALQMKKNYDKGQELFDKLFKAITDRTQGFVDVKNKLVDGTEKIIEYLKWISKTGTDLFANLKHDVIQQLYKTLETLVWTKDLKVAVEKFVDYAKALSSETFRFTKDQFKEIKSLLENTFRPSFEQLLKRLEEAKKQVERSLNIAADAKQHMLKHFDQALDQAKQILNAIQNYVTPATQTINQWITNKSESAYEVYKREKEKITKVIHKKVEQVTQVVTDFNTQVQQIVAPVMHTITTMPQQLINLMVTPFNQTFKVGSVLNFAQNRLRNWREGFKRMQNGFFNFKQNAKGKLAEVALSIQKTVILWRKQALSWVKEALKWSWNQLKTLPARVWRKTVQAAQWTLHAIHLTWVWSRVLFRYARQLILEVSNEMVIWLDSNPFLRKEKN